MSNIEISEAKERVQKIYAYLRELRNRRTPPTVALEKYNWIFYLDLLPTHPSVGLTMPSAAVDGGFELRIARPKETECPSPPTQIRDWINTGWNVFGRQPSYLESKNFENMLGQVRTERFEDDPERVKEWAKWLAQRQTWEEAERPTREATKAFQRFYELKGRLEREGEKFQLWLADGCLQWIFQNQTIDHPVLLRRVDLTFDAKKPEFIIVETEEPTEVYASLFRHCQLDGKIIQQVLATHKQLPCHPLGTDETDSFLRQLVHSFWEKGSVVGEKSDSRVPTHDPIVRRRPVLFLGQRNQGFAAAIENMVEFIASTENLPEALQRVVGYESKRFPKNLISSQGSIATTKLDHSVSLGLPEDVLLTKPANEEQVRVIRKLGESGTVIVQGPPGTGKTHTIANLIGHLLAHGKTVLVTSHTSKALRVVREKVHESLKPLCVSMLDTDEKSRRELEDSVTGIVKYLNLNDQSKLEKEIISLERRRHVLIQKHNDLAAILLKGKKAEYDDLIVGGERTQPCQAARFLAENPDLHWIPGPVEEGSVLPLSEAELVDLYATNYDISPTNDKVLGFELPDVNKLQQEDIFARNVDTYRSLPAKTNPVEDQTIDIKASISKLEHLINLARDTHKQLEIESQWFIEAVTAGIRGKAQVEIWTSLTSQFRTKRDEIYKRQEAIFTFGPTADPGAVADEMLPVGRAILDHLQSGGNLGSMSTFFKGSWKKFIKLHRVNGLAPKVDVHIQAIIALHEVTLLRREILSRWERQMTPHGISVGTEFYEKPEDFVLPFIEQIERAINWGSDQWRFLADLTSDAMIRWNEVEEQAKRATLGRHEVERLKRTAAIVTELASERLLALRKHRLEQHFQAMKRYLTSFSGNSESGHVVFELRTAVDTLDHILYARARRKLVDLTSLRERMTRRLDLIRRLSQKAPGWAAAIQNRQDLHCNGTVPGTDSNGAWKYRQWEQQLNARHELDIDDIQREIVATREEIYEASAKYVEKKSWLAQINRTGTEQQRALVGWLNLQKKLGAGYTKRKAVLLAEGRELLNRCREAVPVWIMPTSRVYESFDPRKTRFDVLILDEASQCDVSDLALFSLANEVVVVGDHEQVSPYGVGQDVDAYDALIDEMLVDVPNARLLDPKTSVYDVARECFGETIRLVEHFRCVPEIIAFSNSLSYSGEIRPLRESRDAKVRPPLIAHRVPDGSYEKKINPEEIDEITALVLATNECDAYRGLTFGIISLVGEDQALRIEEAIRRNMAVDQFEERKILCGTASQFQGDERDVIFISMVQSANGGGPLPRSTADMPRKIMNVAASRAKDQLWVVFSLNPETDLKPEDIRKRLISHAENPNAILSQIANNEGRTQSPFEKEVLKGLSEAGFRIQTQWVVGAYSIDMVAYDRHGNRMAIECDGERWHAPEKLAEDLARQFVLERLGWKFLRIRGSEFYLNKKSGLNRLVKALIEAGIESDVHFTTPDCTEQPSKEDSDLRREVVSKAEEWRRKIQEARAIDPPSVNYGKKWKRKTPQVNDSEES
jgi:very-short-patch-repair endonuclease/DNA polymerase III delta prime subunit